MKVNHNAFAKIGISVFLVGSILVPTFSFAHPAQQKTLEEYCVQILVFESNHNKKFANLNVAYIANKAEQLKKITDQRGITYQKYVSQKDDNDAALSTTLDKIDKLVGSDSEQSIVDMFKKKIIDADQQRQKEINLAIEAFNTDIDQLLFSRKTTFENAKTNFAYEVAEILSNTKNDCKTKSKSVVDVFNYTTGGLKESLEKFSKANDSLGPTTDEFQQLSTTRDAIITHAHTSFNETIEASIIELKESLKL